jgi:formate-dependent nitrite reductase membrane component NrfD
VSDGRNIDSAVGTLSGEASGQLVTKEEAAWHRDKPEVYSSVPSQPEAGWEDPAYYGQPVLKVTVWSADIPTYYYVGGVAGAAAVLAAAAHFMTDDGRLATLSRNAQWIAFGGSLLSAGLLIRDLGRPSRFLNMLRVFRPTSPMNMGTWILTGFGGATTASLLPRSFGALESAAFGGMGLFGLALTGYTGVLVSNTAVPVWQRGRRSLPPMFMASGAAGAAALLHMLPMSEEEHRVVKRFGNLGKAAELAATFAYEAELGLPKVREPLRAGVSGALWNGARICTAASLMLSLFGSRRSRTVRIMSGILGTAGSLALRFAVHEAGKASARDPRSTFHSQRPGQPVIMGPEEPDARPAQP